MEVNIEQHLAKIKGKYTELINFIEKKSFNEDDYQIFIKNLDYQNKNELKEYLHLICDVSFGYQTQFYLTKFERILRDLQNDIKNFFSNYDIFYIFHTNFRILHFLMKEKIIIIDPIFMKKITSVGQMHMIYFSDVFFELLPEEGKDYECFLFSFEKFFKYRFIEGCKESLISIIKKDSLDDFISYLKENETDISTELSFFVDIYDIPILILGYSAKLVECAAFYGSFQIFQYLVNNGVEINQRTMHYSILGNNLDIIHILEKANIKPDETSYELSIMFHKNKIKDYIKTNYFKDDENINNNYLIKILKYHNYSCITSEYINESNFYNFCSYGYYFFVKYLLQTSKLNLNSKFERKLEVKKDIEKVVNKTALCKSIQRRNFDIAKLLLDQKDIDVNVVCSIIQKQNEETIISNKTFTAVEAAIKTQNDEIVELILSKPNIDVNLITSTFILYDEPDDDFKTKCGIKKVKESEENSCYLKVAVAENYNKAIQLLLSNPQIDLSFIVKNVFKNENEIEIDQIEIANINSNIEIKKLLLNHPKFDINRSLICKLTNINDETDVHYYSENSILISAIESKDYELVRYLISMNEIDCNFKSIYKKKYNERSFYEVIRTPLYIAVYEKNTEMIEILLSNPKIDVNAKIKYKSKSFCETTEKDITVLYQAINYNQVELVKLLLSHQSIDVNILSYDSTLRVPEFYELHNIKERKKQKEEEEDDDDDYEFNDDVDDEAIEKLGKVKIFSDIKEFTALHLSLFTRNIEIFNLLLSHDKIDLNIRSIRELKFKAVERIEKTILYSAIQLENSTIINLLLNKQGIDVNKKSIEIYKSLKDPDPCLSRIYHFGVEKETRKEITPLLLAIKNKDTATAQLLLANSNIDVNLPLAVNKKIGDKILMAEKLTLLFMAVKNDDCELIKLLLENKKIDVDATNVIDTKGEIIDHYEVTALQNALVLKKLDIARILIDHKKKQEK